MAVLETTMSMSSTTSDKKPGEGCRLFELMQYDCKASDGNGQVTCFPLPHVFRL